MRQKFRSRVSILLLLFVFGVLWLSMKPLFIDGRYLLLLENGEFLLIMIVTLLPLLLLFVFFWKIQYEIVGMDLEVKLGSMNLVRVPTYRIYSVERSYNPLSSPASSLKRLKVNFRQGSKKNYLLISPIDEQEFIRTLVATNSSIRVDDRLLQKESLLKPWNWDI